MDVQRNIIFDLGGVIFETNLATFVPLEAGVALLEECYAHAQENGHKLYICSNGSAQAIEQLARDFPHLFSMFHGVVIPSIAQAKKPDTKIFQYLLDTYTLIPHQTVFIDDQLRNVEAARNTGMLGIHLQTHDEVRDELQRLGFLV